VVDEIQIRRETHEEGGSSIWLSMKQDGFDGWLCIRSTYPGNYGEWLSADSGLRSASEPLVTIYPA